MQLELAAFMNSHSKPVLVSFSGIDGAGKSTQIERLYARLVAHGLRVTRLAFWDDVVVLPRFRAGITHKILGGEQGTGAPGKPVRRNDKNARKWYLILARAPFYVFDVLSLRRVVRRAILAKPDVIIFDRYIYDQIAHIPNNQFGHRCRSFLLHLAPKPHVAYLLDAEPEVATARKPEYPLDFVEKYRSDYFSLRPLAREIFVVPSDSIEAVEDCILREFERHFPLPAPPCNFGSPSNTHPQRVSA